LHIHSSRSVDTLVVPQAFGTRLPGSARHVQ
jgi:hypothetical protein